MTTDLKIVETVYSVWSYHLSIDGIITLCGRKDIMSTQAPLSTWGVKPDHIPYKYCTECETAANLGE